jgi:hypothetical protein
VDEVLEALRALDPQANAEPSWARRQARRHSIEQFRERRGRELPAGSSL